MGAASGERSGALAVGMGASVLLHGVVVLWLAHAPEPLPALAEEAQATELIEVQVVPAAGNERPASPHGLTSVRPSAGAGALTAVMKGPSSAAKGTKAPSPVVAGAQASGGLVPEAPPLAAELTSVGGTSAGGSGSGSASGASTGSVAGAPGSAGRAADAAALLASRLSTAALRCYPPAAVKFRLSGEARLAFCLREDGRAGTVSVARSSGAEALDRAAAECVLPGALPFPGAAGCYELPVRFSTREH